MRRNVNIKESAFPSSAPDAAMIDTMKSDKAGSESNSSESAFLFLANDKPEIKKGDKVNLSGAKSIIGIVTNIFQSRIGKTYLVVWEATRHIGRCLEEDLELIH